MKPYYDDGRVTIYHGDCREILPTIEPVRLVLTDPPYAIGSGKPEWRVTASVGTGLHYAAKTVEKGGAMLVFNTSSGRGMDFTFGAIGGALPFNRVLAWHKRSQQSRVAGPWRWDVVMILAFGRACFGGADRSSLIQTDKSNDADVAHPSAVPLEVATWLYEPFAPATVLDPFMGSGSLLIPAANAGHRAIGIEADEKYCEMAAQRLSRATDTDRRPLGVLCCADEGLPCLLPAGHDGPHETTAVDYEARWAGEILDLGLDGAA